MRFPKVSIIIVNYNQKDLTHQCLKSLNKVTYPNFEIILVDNGSTDGSVENIKEKFPKVKLIELNQNTGFVGGNNKGIKKAHGPYILLLNNDTIVTPSFLDPLIKRFIQRPDLGILQSKIYVMGKPKYLDNVVSYMTSSGFLNHDGYMKKDSTKYSKFIYTFSTKGACMMIRKEILKLGLFDPEYFAYFEETDLCWRTWILGYKCAFEPKSIIYHKMGATSLLMDNEFIQFHSFKNRICTIIKNASVTNLSYMLPLHIVTTTGLSIYFLHKKPRVSLAIINAVIWNLKHIDSTLAKRRKVQRLRQTSDRQIFQHTFKDPPLGFYLRHLSFFKSQFK